jgi:hypothetical protein
MDGTPAATTQLELPTALVQALHAAAAEQSATVAALLGQLLAQQQVGRRTGKKLPLVASASTLFALPVELIGLVFLFLPCRVVRGRVSVVCTLFRAVVHGLPSYRHVLNRCGTYDQHLMLLDSRQRRASQTTAAPRAPTVGDAAQEAAAQGPVSFAAFAVYDRKIYRFGGRTNGGVRLRTCEVMDPMAVGRGGAWTALPPMRSVRSACGVGVVRGRAYVLGGCDDSREVATYEVFDLATHQWVGAEPLPMPFGVCEHAVATHRDAIYIVGGCRHRFSAEETATNEVLVFRPDTDEWGHLPPLPAPRRLATAVAASLLAAPDDGASLPAGASRALLLVVGGFDRVHNSSFAVAPQPTVLSVQVHGMSYVAPPPASRAPIWAKTATGLPAPVAAAVAGNSELVVLRVQEAPQQQQQHVLLPPAAAPVVTMGSEVLVESTSLQHWRSHDFGSGTSSVLWSRVCTLAEDDTDRSHALLVVD